MQNNLPTVGITPLPHCLLCLALQMDFLDQLGLVMLREKTFSPGYKYGKLVCCLSQNYAWRNLVKRCHYKHWQGCRYTSCKVKWESKALAVKPALC